MGSKRALFAMGSTATLTGAAGAAFTFADVEFWVGSGANEAAIVIDWNGQDGAGAQSLAWGYRWDGDATGQDMLTAVINADANLYGRFAAFGFGDALVGLGYDTDGDGFGISDGTDFGPAGLAFAGTSDGATATDGDDLYAEGWSTGFWSYWLGDAPFGGGAWDEAPVGFGARMLADGGWDGYRFAPGFVSSEPREPVAAVPAVPVSAVIGLAAAVCARRRRA
jgi:hypothetical protein